MATANDPGLHAPGATRQPASGPPPGLLRPQASPSLTARAAARAWPSVPLHFPLPASGSCSGRLKSLKVGQERYFWSEFWQTDRSALCLCSNVLCLFARLPWKPQEAKNQFQSFVSSVGSYP